MTPLLRLVLSFLLVTAATTGYAQTPVELKIAVVAVKGKGGPNLTPQVKAMLERPLRADATVVPAKAYQKSARKLGVKPKDFGSPDLAASIGKDALLTHVLLVEGRTERIGEGKPKRAVSSANVTLIAVETGEQLVSSSFVLKGKRLTRDVAEQILAEVRPKLAPAPPPVVPEPVSETPPAPEPVAEAPPAPPPAPAEAPTGELAPAEGADAALAAAPAEMNPEAAPPPAAEEPEVAAEATATMVPSEPETAAPRWRPGLFLRLGALAFARNAEIQDESTTTALSYEPPEDGLPLPMPAGFAQIEIYPFAFGGRGAWYEGIGLEAEGLFTQVETEMGTPPTTVQSQVLGGRGGLSLRFVLWSSSTAADLRVRAGYSLFQFPLDEGTFPGVTFAGPYAGGAFTIPLLRQLAIVLAGTYTPMLAVSDRAKDLGAEFERGSAFSGEGGLRLTFSPIEIALMGRLEQYSASFRGASTLTGVSFTDASFQDRYTSAYLTIGLVL